MPGRSQWTAKGQMRKRKTMKTIEDPIMVNACVWVSTKTIVCETVVSTKLSHPWWEQSLIKEDMCWYQKLKERKFFRLWRNINKVFTVFNLCHWWNAHRPIYILWGLLLTRKVINLGITFFPTFLLMKIWEGCQGI